MGPGHGPIAPGVGGGRTLAHPSILLPAPWWQSALRELLQAYGKAGNIDKVLQAWPPAWVLNLFPPRERRFVRPGEWAYGSLVEPRGPGHLTVIESRLVINKPARVRPRRPRPTHHQPSSPSSPPAVLTASHPNLQPSSPQAVLTASRPHRPRQLRPPHRRQVVSR